MVISDDDYVDGSDDGGVDLGPLNRQASSDRRSRSTRADKDSNGFEVTRTWETLTEGADGTITGAVESLLQAGKRQRWPIREESTHSVFLADRCYAADSSRTPHRSSEGSSAMSF